jgi:hypothetical protein
MYILIIIECPEQTVFIQRLSENVNYSKGVKITREGFIIHIGGHY